MYFVICIEGKHFTYMQVKHLPISLGSAHGGRNYDQRISGRKVTNTSFFIRGFVAWMCLYFEFECVDVDKEECKKA